MAHAIFSGCQKQAVTELLSLHRTLLLSLLQWPTLPDCQARRVSLTQLRLVPTAGKHRSTALNAQA